MRCTEAVRTTADLGKQHAAQRKKELAITKPEAILRAVMTITTVLITTACAPMAEHTDDPLLPESHVHEDHVPGTDDEGAVRWCP